MEIKVILLLATSIFTYSCNNQLQEAGDKGEDKKSDTAVLVTPSGEAKTVITQPYQNQLAFGKMKFTIASPQSASANTFTVVPSGFTISNDTIFIDCEGTVVQSEVWDLDGDNAPELLVVTQSRENKKGKAYIFSSNNNKSMSMVNLPEFAAEAKETKGYSGHDDFAFVESSFCHRFPLYENGNPLNKTRQLQYKLKPGEAMKQLVLDKVIEY